MKKGTKIALGVVGGLVIIGAVAGTGGKGDKDSSSMKDIVVDSSVVSSVSDEKDQASSEEKDTVKEQITLDEQVIWETKDVRLKAKRLEYDDIWGWEIKVEAESLSDKDISIYADAVIVNDFMISDLTSISVTAGNKTNDSIELLSSGLEAAGIEDIGKIELYLHTSDPDTYDVVDRSDCITLKTSSFDSMDTSADTDGAELYNKDGIKIVGRYVDEDSFWGQAVLLYIENTSDKNIIIQCDSISVNGYTIDGIMSASVYAGKKSFDDITLLSSSLEENGITSIDNVEIEFRILDENYSEIAKSGKVSFSTK